MVLTKKPLSKGIKTFYGFGDMWFGAMTMVELFFFVFFLTNVAKFSLPMVAIIGSVTSIVDAVLSPFYGAVISGTKPMKWGRNRSWMLVAPPFVVILFMLQFTKIGPSEAISAVIVSLGFILSHIIWNIAWVGNVSLIPVMANNPEERGFLSGRRMTWTALAGVFFSYVGQPLAMYIGRVSGNEILGYTLLAGIMAFLMMLGYWLVFKLSEGYEPTAAEEAELASTSEKPVTRVSVGDMVKTVTKNPPLIALLVGDFFRFIGFFVIMASITYYFTYVAQDMTKLAPYMLISALAGVLGAAISSKIIQKLSARNTTIVGLLGTGIILIIASFVAMNVTLFFILVPLGMLCFNIVGAAIVALYADVAIYGEWKTGENATPFVMGLMNLSLKLAVISRGIVIPLVLGAAGFSAKVAPDAVSEAVKQAVININMLIPGITSIIGAVIILLTYKLTQSKVEEIQAEIDAR
ncbi:MFS transporter [Alkalibaculum sp. M08DMB]|uniref:MFS transporter n=1 Tax=Alkalibaculum sporogenes TaxID=2655001 RepID=A0A6A7KCT6_9FIRM|nr:MFS transporter [Alkalibaculum sporogenes]MPW27165.1 MFS transporter [Alkalibaculum sporogenes]